MAGRRLACDTTFQGESRIEKFILEKCTLGCPFWARVGDRKSGLATGLEQPVKTSPAGMKPFLIAWSICLAAILSRALLVPDLLRKLDFSCFYTAGILLRTHPSQLYDLSEQQRIYYALISASGKVQPILQPAFTASFLRAVLVVPLPNCVHPFFSLQLRATYPVL